MKTFILQDIPGIAIKNFQTSNQKFINLLWLMKTFLYKIYFVS